MTAGRWFILLGPDTRVVGVAGGAPEAWVGRSLATFEGAPAALRDAASSLAAALHHPHAGVPFARALVTPADGAPAEVELTAVAGVFVARRPCDPRALLARALAPFRAQADERDVELTLSVGPRVAPTVWLDAEKITWVVSTLVGNALRYVRSGTRRLPGGIVRVIVDVDERDDRLVVAVEDDGCGVPPAAVAALFDPDEAGVARAVSLAVVRDLLTAHGGSLEVVSSIEPGASGTTVRVRIAPR